MKQVYTNIIAKKGSITNGLCKLKVVPKEWIDGSITPSYSTGTVTNVNLIAGRDWINIECTPNSYDFIEEEKENAAGKYFEITLSGTINITDISTRQILETLRNHELVSISTFKNNTQKITGTEEFGLKLLIQNKTPNNSSNYNFTLKMLAETSSAHYI